MASNSGDKPLEGCSSSEKVGQAGGQEGLTEAQALVLERCIRALKEAKSDSQTLVALLLITRLCPASALNERTLKRIFEAVGLNLPARLLVTAYRGSDNTSLTRHDVLSLGTALLAALSTDSDMILQPELLAPIFIVLGLVSIGPLLCESSQTGDSKSGYNFASAAQSVEQTLTKQLIGTDSGGACKPASEDASPKLDDAIASDCYQVLTALAAIPKGVEYLLKRGAVPALCKAVELKQTMWYEKGVPILICLLSGKLKEREKVWSQHNAELIGLLARLAKEFFHAAPQTKLDMCAQLVHFLPNTSSWAECVPLKTAVKRIWEVLRSILQSKLTMLQIRPVLVLSACLLDLYGWEPVGPPKFCCLLVNRACVEVRVGLEVLPEEEFCPELVQLLTGCYRIMEAAIEQACSETEEAEGHQLTIPAVSLQQSRQVINALEGAFSSTIFYLKKADVSVYRDPFIFATFRCLCCWLAEETSCLEEEVFELLPFLINYTRHHFQGSMSKEDLAHWISVLSIDEERRGWAGDEPLRYLLPCVSHLSAEDVPRKMLLNLDTPGLLVEFFQQSWISMKEKSNTGWARNPSMETTCSVFISLILTEPERAGSDPCFKALEAVLYDAIPLLVNKPCLLVLAAHCCTLGLMLGQLTFTSSGPVEAPQRRFLSTTFRFLRNALDWSSSPGPVAVSWNESWLDVSELWRLSLLSLSGCIQAQPALAAVIREDGWLRYTLAMLDQCSALPDEHTQEALEGALCSIAVHCPVAKQEIGNMMKNKRGVLNNMTKLKKSL